MRYLVLVALVVTTVGCGSLIHHPVTTPPRSGSMLVVVEVPTPWCVRAIVQSDEGARRQVLVCTDTEEFCRTNRDVVVKLFSGPLLRLLSKTRLLAATTCRWEREPRDGAP